MLLLLVVWATTYGAKLEIYPPPKPPPPPSATYWVSLCPRPQLLATTGSGRD